MKIVNRLEFLKLPPGTLFQQCEERWIFGDLMVKYDSLIFGEDGDGDFISMDFKSVEAHSSEELFSRWENMAESGASYPLDLIESTGRDGCFVRDALFMVYERADMIKLRDFFVTLTDALKEQEKV